MILPEFSHGLFIVINSLIALYIVIYAFIFLKRTKEYPDRRPWELLFVGAMFFLMTNVISFTTIFKGNSLFGLDIFILKMIIEFGYATLVLMAFITQSQMILKSDLILITKKIDHRKREAEEVKRKKQHMHTGKTIEEFNPKKDVEEEMEREMKQEGFHSEIKSEKEFVKEEKKHSKQ